MGAAAARRVIRGSLRSWAFAIFQPVRAYYVGGTFGYVLGRFVSARVVSERTPRGMRIHCLTVRGWISPSEEESQVTLRVHAPRLPSIFFAVAAILCGGLSLVLLAATGTAVLFVPLAFWCFFGLFTRARFRDHRAFQDAEWALAGRWLDELEHGLSRPDAQRAFGEGARDGVAP